MVRVLGSVPPFVIVVIEALVMYAATAVAKLAFAQLDPLFAVWYRVGFMVVLLLIWRMPHIVERRDALRREPVCNGVMLLVLGLSLVGMNTAFYVAIANMDMGIAVAIEFIGPLSVAVITGNGWRERVGIAVAAAGMALIAGVSFEGHDNGHFLIGFLAILVSGALWGTYIFVGHRVASAGNPLDNLAIAAAMGWCVQSLVLGVPAVMHVIHPKANATWVLKPGGPWKLVGLLLIISVLASFIPYILDQFVMRRTTSGAFSVMQAINPAVAVVIGLMAGERPGVGELTGVACIICAVCITYSRSVPRSVVDRIWMRTLRKRCHRNSAGR